VTWEEVERALKKKDASMLVFEAPQVLERYQKVGDLLTGAEVETEATDLRGVAAVGRSPPG